MGTSFGEKGGKSKEKSGKRKRKRPIKQKTKSPPSRSPEVKERPSSLPSESRNCERANLPIVNSPPQGNSNVKKHPQAERSDHKSSKERDQKSKSREPQRNPISVEEELYEEEKQPVHFLDEELSESYTDFSCAGIAKSAFTDEHEVPLEKVAPSRLGTTRSCTDE